MILNKSSHIFHVDSLFLKHKNFNKLTKPQLSKSAFLWHIKIQVGKPSQLRQYNL